jgi:hypothetical protein
MKWDEYVKQYSHLKLFIKGLPGSGKTYLAASCSQLGKTKYIDMEGGLVAASKVINPDNIDITVINLENANKASQQFSQAMNEVISGGYEWVVVDSFSEFAGLLQVEYSKSDGQNKDWITIIEKIKKTARFLRDGKFNTIITCHMKEKNNEVILPGTTSVEVPGMFGILGQCDYATISGDQKFVLKTRDFAPHVRDRFGVLDGTEVIDAVNPSELLQKMIDGIKSVESAKSLAVGV